MKITLSNFLDITTNISKRERLLYSLNIKVDEGLEKTYKFFPSVLNLFEDKTEILSYLVSSYYSPTLELTALVGGKEKWRVNFAQHSLFMRSIHIFSSKSIFHNTVEYYEIKEGEGLLIKEVRPNEYYIRVGRNIISSQRVWKRDKQPA
ncbi:MAG: hypothetical protein J5956_11295 [Ruminococcus sp.]|jgi:hypothetical protein|nr:hypothetical protein [Ruminococcus sp.]